MAVDNHRCTYPPTTEQELSSEDEDDMLFCLQTVRRSAFCVSHNIKEM